MIQPFPSFPRLINIPPELYQLQQLGNIILLHPQKVQPIFLHIKELDPSIPLSPEP